MKDLEEKEYKYMVYKIFEIDEEDTEKAVNPLLDRELTLCTCTIGKSKRLVIRAKFAEK